MKKNKISRTEAIFLLVLVITMPIVFTALQPEIKDNEAIQNSSIDFFSKIIQKVISFFDIIPSVSADEPVGCCEDTNGIKCQDGIKQSKCSSGFHPNEQCNGICAGCCVHTDNGICDSNSANSLCLPPDTIFSLGDVKCENTPICEMGCCFIGQERKWSTSKACGAIYHGFWDNTVPDKSTCLASVPTDEMGCCTYDCKYETAEQCGSFLGLTAQQALDQGHFVQRKCYNNVQKCNCEVGGTPKCSDLGPDRYKSDTCGNVYSDEIEKVCSNGQWCDPLINDCTSSMCKNVVDNWDSSKGAFSVIPGRHGNDRKSGETWCVYDRPGLTAGNGTEPAGSVHQLRSCVNGVESVDWVDYRTEICGEILIDKNGNTELDRDKRYSRSGNDYISKAYWLGNNWRVCILLTSETDCNANPTCFWTPSSFASLVNVPQNKIENWFGVREDTLISSDLSQLGGELAGKQRYTPPRCLPKYPSAFETGQDNFPNPSLLCNLASVECVLQDRVFGDTNPECDDNNWLTFMTRRCSAIGDCGAYVNFLHGVDGKDTFTDQGILVAEIGLRTDINNIAKKDIAKQWDVTQDLTDYGKFITSVKGEPGGVGAALGTGIGLVLASALVVLGIVFQFLPIATHVVTIGPPLIGTGWAYLIGAGSSWHLSLAALSNPFFIAGALLILISYKIPQGAGAETLRTSGIGLAGGGLAAGLGAALPLALTIGVLAGTIYALFFAVWDVDHIVVKCMPWQPPSGQTSANDCEQECEKKDNNGIIRPCTRYRCKSISLACDYIDNINVGGVSYPVADALCTKIEDDHLEPQMISVQAKNLINGNTVSLNHELPSLPPSEIRINDQVSQLSEITISFELNENALCWYDIRSKPSILTMSYPMGTYSKTHTFMPPITPQDPYVYVRCTDAYENANIGEYVFKFMNTVQEDIQEPIITRVDPIDGWGFPNGLEKAIISLEIVDSSPKVNCTFSRTNSLASYEAMKAESGECESNWNSGKISCEFPNTPLVPDQINTFYFKCKDSATNPTLSIPGPNVMQDSLEVKYNPTPALKISSFSPSNNEQISGCELQSPVTLKVETAEGSEEGKAICYWATKQDYSDENIFDITNVAYHEENITIENTGPKTLYIKCVDSVGNSAEIPGGITFSIIKDDQPPFITRLYKSGGLVLVTNEPSTCKYNKNIGCSFNATHWRNALPFSTSDSITHEVEWPSNTLYVRCYDKCDNGNKIIEGGPCTAIIIPENI